jgi:hypothetical protein
MKRLVFYDMTAYETAFAFSQGREAPISLSRHYGLRSDQTQVPALLMSHAGR